MTMRAAARSTTELSGVAMTPFVPPFFAFIGVCMYLGLYVEPQGFVSCFHFLFCFINARVLLSPPHARAQARAQSRACVEPFIWILFFAFPSLVPIKASLLPPGPTSGFDLIIVFFQ